MSLQRIQKRENEQGKEILGQFINSFFTRSCKLKTRAEIQKAYKDHESQWMYYVHKKNNGTKTKSMFMMDSFESAIMKAHKVILKSKQSVTSKLSMLRVLRHVQGKSMAYHFFLELSLWVKHISGNYKIMKQKKHEEMINPSLKHVKPRLN